MLSSLVFLATLALLLPRQGRAAAQESVISSGTFVTRLGVDTIAIERFTRTRTRLEGEIVRRTPSLTLATYVMNLVDGRPVDMRMTELVGDGARPMSRRQSLNIAFSAESAVAEFQLDTLVVQRRQGAGMLLWMPYSWAMAEVQLAALRTMSSDSAGLNLIPATPIGIGQARPVATWIRGNEAYQWNLLGAGPAVYSIDDQSRIDRVDGTKTTTRSITERSGDLVDVASIARRFAATEQVAGRFGSLNTDRDTVRARIGDAQIVVDYGRPRLRGRRVFVGGVLGDTLWRTGANAATQLETSAAMLIGDQIVPAGKYTLWTKIAADNSSYTLIVNRQTGQWGVPQFNYRAERDLLWVPLMVRALPAPVEQFTIAIDGNATGGVLRLSWDQTELWVPFALATAKR
jgi:hypothetical protein